MKFSVIERFNLLRHCFTQNYGILRMLQRVFSFFSSDT